MCQIDCLSFYFIYLDYPFDILTIISRNLSNVFHLLVSTLIKFAKEGHLVIILFFFLFCFVFFVYFSVKT